MEDEDVFHGAASHWNENSSNTEQVKCEFILDICPVSLPSVCICQLARRRNSYYQLNHPFTNDSPVLKGPMSGYLYQLCYVRRTFYLANMQERSLEHLTPNHLQLSIPFLFHSVLRASVGC